MAVVSIAGEIGLGPWRRQFEAFGTLYRGAIYVPTHCLPSQMYSLEWNGEAGVRANVGADTTVFYFPKSERWQRVALSPGALLLWMSPLKTVVTGSAYCDTGLDRPWGVFAGNPVKGASGTPIFVVEERPEGRQLLLAGLYSRHYKVGTPRATSTRSFLSLSVNADAVNTGLFFSSTNAPTLPGHQQQLSSRRRKIGAERVLHRAQEAVRGGGGN